MKYLLIIALFVFAVVSCEEESSQDYLNGTVVGFVNLVDFDGYVYPSEMNDNIHVVANPGGYSTYTNSLGRFQLGIISGSYDISFTKDGFGMTKIAGLQVVGGNVPYLYKDRIYLYRMPYVSLDSYTSEVNYSGDIELEYTLNCESNMSECIIEFYIGEDEDVSSDNYLYKFEGPYTNGEYYTNFVNFSDINLSGHTSLFVKMYSRNWHEPQQFDVMKNQWFYATRRELQNLIQIK